MYNFFYVLVLKGKNMKKILIFGCKTTGEGLYVSLSKDKTNDIWFYDDNLHNCSQMIVKTGKILSMYLVKEIIHTFDIVIYTPSIKRDNWLLSLAKSNNILVLNEFEYAFLKLKSECICVTGTDGKTTTTLMLKSIFDYANLKSQVAGNIGYPLSLCVDESSNYDCIIAEVSSFMLEDSNIIAPKISVITNIATDHLDWHKSFKNYCIAKSNLVKFLTSKSLAILNADDENSLFLSMITKAKVLHFSLKHKVEGAYLKESYLCSFIGGIEEKIISINDLQVVGEHNISNALCAIVAAKGYGIKTSAIRNGLKNFCGIRHRLQKIGEKNNVIFVNDSKSTSVHSTQSALKAFKGNKIGLILGGQKKMDDYSLLINDEFFKDVKVCAFFGESGQELYDIAQNKKIKNIFLLSDLKQSIKTIYDFLKKDGGTLLFSPACASFDCYKNFEERGNHFCEIINELIIKDENI